METLSQDSPGQDGNDQARNARKHERPGANAEKAIAGLLEKAMSDANRLHRLQRRTSMMNKKLQVGIVAVIVTVVVGLVFTSPRQMANANADDEAAVRD